MPAPGPPPIGACANADPANKTAPIANPNRTAMLPFIAFSSPSDYSRGLPLFVTFLCPVCLLALVLRHQSSQRLHGARNFTRYIAIHLGQQIFFLRPSLLLAKQSLLLANQPLLLGHPRRCNPRRLLPPIPLMQSACNASHRQRAP